MQMESNQVQPSVKKQFMKHFRIADSFFSVTIFILTQIKCQTLLDRIRWLTLLITVWISYISAKEVRIVCYYTNWSVYRPGSAKFSPQNINPYLCTHLVYAFGGFTKENTLKPFDKYQDIEKGGYAKFVGLKTYNKNLKTLLAIGGWNEGSTRFSPMVANADRRKDLAKNVIKFLRQNHFDGLDLDWEYPSFRDGGKPRDKDNYAQFVQELREEFDRESEKTGRPRLLLTMAVPAGIEYINKGYDIPKLTKYLDWMNILSYDYHSAYEPAVNHHSPLFALEEESEYSYDIDLNVDYTIKHYLEAGADRSKLVLGIPTYGRSYTLYNEDASEVGAPADGPGEMGEATRENGYLAYYEICESIKSGGWIVESPFPDAMGPYAFKENQWVGFDDAAIASKKAEYVAEHGLGGIMFWSIDNDDFRGNCGNRPYPIIEAAKEALLKAYGLTDASLVVTKKPIKSRTKTRGTTAKPTTTTKALSTKSLNSGGRQSSRRKVNRVQDEDNKISHRRRRPTSKPNKRRILVPKVEDSATESSLIITPSYTTPEPPSTPNTGGDFKCEEEGFYPHPRDCKKYFWCLSGTADQIIAHQFTCPAGLYFNKAAASCDYSQNVLCNKKMSKTTTTSTTASSTTDSTTSSTTTESILSTRRPLPKITAATSRTTYTTTTEAPEYEDEYEEYEDEEDIPNGDIKQDSEEDPRVIKELIELIKKAGGIEELEKQLKFQDDGSATIVNSGSTTPSTISKSLYQRVLAKTASKDSKFNTGGRNTLTYNILNRNSRGPQNEGLEQNKEEAASVIKSRPQYSSIQRQRPSTETAPTNEEEPEKVEDETADENPQKEQPEENSGRSFYKNSQPEYVTIRRQRISTTTELPKEKEILNYKRLGEDIQEDNSEESEEEKIRNRFRSTTVATTYVTIRRTRPTTTSKDEEEEEKSTEGKILTRPVGQSTNESDTTLPSEYSSNKQTRPQLSFTTSKYVEIRSRPTTETSSTTQENSVLPEEQGTSINANQTIINKLDDETPISNTQSPEENTVGKLVLGVETEKPLEEQNSQSIIDRVKDLIKQENEKPSTERVTTEAPREKKKPQLYEPRPFSINTRTRPTVTTTELPSSQPEVKVSPPSSTRKAFRKKAFELANSLNNAKINNQENNINVNDNVKNRFSDPESTDVNAKEEEEGRNRLRGRGSSRFKLENVLTTTLRPRPRIRITTEEADNDYETTESVRKFRPDISAEIADLSSLTAVDLSEFAAGRRRRPSSRRLSPRPSPETTTATTTTTTKKPEPSLKTGSRTLPLARKFLSSATFGKSRRVLKPALNESSNSTENLSNKINLKLRPVNNQSEVNSEASTNSNIITENDTKLLRFRKYGAASTTVETVVSKENRPSTLRPIRRIIRRFRTTTTTTAASTTNATTSITTTTTQPTTTASQPTTTKAAEEAQNNINVTNIEENLNYNIISKTDSLEEIKNFTTASPLEDIKTSSVRNDVANNTNIEENLTEPKARNSVLEVVDANETDDDDDELKSSEEDDEDENIKLSESNIRENSQISNFPNGNIVQELKPGRKFFRPIYGSLSKNDDDIDRPIVRRPVTEPNIVIRTRKIIRKLRPSPTPEVAGETPKVIKRLRPTTVAIESSTPKQFYGRRRFGYFRSTSTTTEKAAKSEEAEAEVEQKVVKPTFGKRKVGISNLRNLAEKSINKSEPVSQFSLNKSIYNRRKFFSSTTTSTTTSTSTTTEVIPESSETSEFPKEVTTFEIEASTNVENENGTTSTDEEKITTELPTSTSDYDIGLTSTETTTFEIGNTSVTESVQNERTTQDEEILRTTQNESTSENVEEDESIGTTQNAATFETVQDEETSETLLNTETTPEGIQGEVTSESILNKDNFKQFIYGGFKLNQTDQNNYFNNYSKEGLIYNEENRYGLTQNTTEELPNADLDNTPDEQEENTLTTTLEEDEEKNAKTVETTTQRKSTTESVLNSLYKRRRFEFSRNKTENIKLKQNNLSSKFRFNTKEKRKELQTEFTNFEHVEEVSEPKIIETTDYKDNIIYEPSTYAAEEENSTTYYNTDAVTTTENEEVQTTEILSNQNELSTLITDVETTSFDGVTNDDLLLTTSTSSTLPESTSTEEDKTEEQNSSTSEYPVDTSSTTAAILTTEATSKLDLNETTITTTEYTTTTTRKPNRIFRPIASRPKFTFRQRTTENTSPDSVSSTATTSARIYKSSRRYNQLNRFTSTSTEKNDPNEELGYGSVKPFKPTLRFSTPNPEEEGEVDDGKQVEEDGFEEEKPERTYFGKDDQKSNIQFSRSYIRKGFKTQNVENENEEGEEPAEDEHAEEEDEAEVISQPKYTPEDAEEEAAIINRPEYAAKDAEKEEEGVAVINRPKYVSKGAAEEGDEFKTFNRPKYIPKVAEKENDETRIFNRPKYTPKNAEEDDEVKIFNRPKYTPKAAEENNDETRVFNRPKNAEEVEDDTKVFNQPKYTPKDIEEEEDDEEEEEQEEDEAKIINRPKYTPKSVNYFTQKPSTRRTFRKFTTATTPSVVTQNLTDIDVAAISLRNKNLFNKTRKMNTPFAGVTQTTEPTVKEVNLELNETIVSSNDTSFSSSSPPEILVTSSEAPTSTTEFASYSNGVVITEQAKTTEATDKPTTLLHIFAETESSIQDTTAASNETADVENNRKLEKLIEVNRLIKVSAKEDKIKSGSGVVESKTTLETMPKLDRIGLINRLTVIKVVNGLNASALDSLERKPDAPDHRSDRKLDLFEGLNVEVDPNSKTHPINLIHIDSKSEVTKITPKPFFKIETSTIPLEGLFQTDSPLRYHNTYKSDSLNELLEGENSNYVNVRILEQDPSRSNRIRLDERAKFIPVRILKDEEEVTMKADVVEVTPINSKDQIKIVPIAVSFQKKIP